MGERDVSNAAASVERLDAEPAIHKRRPAFWMVAVVFGLIGVVLVAPACATRSRDGGGDAGESVSSSVSTTSTPSATSTSAATTSTPASTTSTSVATTSSPSTTSTTSTTAATTSTTAATTTTIATTTTVDPSVHPLENPAYELAWFDEMNAPRFDWDITGEPAWQWYLPCGYTDVNGRFVPDTVLIENNDSAMKIHENYVGRDGLRYGVQLHEPTGNSLKLHGYNNLWPEFSEAGHRMAGGMISARNLHSQAFGYWEVRFRIPQITQGQHWAIWLVNDDGTWPLEIDLVEVISGAGRTGAQFQTNVHWATSDSTKSDSGQSHEWAGQPSDWYTIGFEWTDRHMRWFVDGELLRTVPVSALVGNVDAPKEMTLQITPEVGGNWPGPIDGSTRWPMTLEVDYVRAYSHAGLTIDQPLPSLFAERCGQ